MHDPMASIHALDAVIAGVDGEARHLLKLLREKQIGEMVGDLDSIRAVLAPTFSFVSHVAGGRRRDLAPGRADAAMFVPLCASEDLVMWVDWDHLVAQNDVVAGDGRLHLSCSAATAPRYGVPVDDADAWYLVESQLVAFIDVEGARIVREVVYSDPATQRVTAVAPELAPRREDLRARLSAAAGAA